MGHGGDLGEARALIGEADDEALPWIDLSTGINPRPYHFSPLKPDMWARLPARQEQRALLDAARGYYAVPEGAEIVAAPGSDALIQLLPELLPAGRVAIAGPTYREHEKAWARRGKVTIAADAAEAANAGDIVVLVNPNNPDGRTVPPETLAEMADALSRRGGWLIVDEAFADTVPGVSAVGLVPRRNVLVLRSFGKFFGLAGLRLGFAVAPPALAETLHARLGPWPASGPAIAIGKQALADAAWQKASLDQLSRDAAALEDLLTRAEFEIVGGTPLFRLAVHPVAEEIFFRLLRRHIYVRRFAERPDWLRFGLPADHQAFERLKAALTGDLR